MTIAIGLSVMTREARAGYYRAVQDLEPTLRRLVETISRYGTDDDRYYARQVLRTLDEIVERIHVGLTLDDDIVRPDVGPDVPGGGAQ